jgi:hypothetical protein
MLLSEVKEVENTSATGFIWVLSQFEFGYFSRRPQQLGGAAINRCGRCFAANAARNFCELYIQKTSN